MSKTYRRQTGNRWWKGKKFVSDWGDESTKWERDKISDHSLNQSVKDYTKTARRAKDREQINKIYRLDNIDDWDYINYEKKFLGVIWYYD